MARFAFGPAQQQPRVLDLEGLPPELQAQLLAGQGELIEPDADHMRAFLGLGVSDVKGPVALLSLITKACLAAAG